MKLSRFVLNTTKHTLNANVDGIATTLAKLPPQQATREGFSLDLALKSLPLTPKAAKRLNSKLGLDGTFKAGRSLGSATAVAHFEWLGVTGGEITITIDHGFQEKLASIEADVFPTTGAKPTGFSPTVISIPLEGGQVSPDTSIGVLRGKGGLAFVESGPPPQPSVSFPCTLISFESHSAFGSGNLKEVPFSGSFATFPSAIAAQADPVTGEISAASLPLALHPDFAAVLNYVLGAPKGKPKLFTAGELLGTVAFRAQTR